MKTKRLGAWLCGAALSLAAGCADRETVSPAPATTSTGSGTTSETGTTTTTDTGTTTDGGPPKRTISLRSPLGGPANNLLLDGDFELSTSSGTGQYAWRKFDAAGSTELPLTVETGGLCRSGLSCAKLHKGEVLFGRGTAAPLGKGHVMAMSTRMPDGVKCNKVTLIAVECDALAVIKVASPAQQPVNGWCRYQGSFGPSQASVCLYLQNSLAEGQEALVDSAVLGPDDGTVPLEAHILDEPEPLDAGAAARMANMRDYLRRTMPFGPPRGAAQGGRPASRE